MVNLIDYVKVYANFLKVKFVYYFLFLRIINLGMKYSQQSSFEKFKKYLKSHFC